MDITYVEPVPGYSLIYIQPRDYRKAFTTGWGYILIPELVHFLNESEMILMENWVDDLVDGFYKLGFASEERCKEFITLLEEYRT